MEYYLFLFFSGCFALLGFFVLDRWQLFLQKRGFYQQPKESLIANVVLQNHTITALGANVSASTMASSSLTHSNSIDGSQKSTLINKECHNNGIIPMELSAKVDDIIMINHNSDFSISGLIEIIKGYESFLTIKVFVWSFDVNQWLPLMKHNIFVSKICIGVQLISGTSIVQAEHLQQFRRAIQTFSCRMSVDMQSENLQTVIEQQTHLQKLFSDIDLQVRLFVIPCESQVFSFDHIQQACLMCGLAFNHMSVFEYISVGELKAPLFQVMLLDSINGADRLVSLEQKELSGILLVMNFAALSDPLSVFELMLSTAKQLSHYLKGQIIDEKSEVIDDEYLNHVRMSLRHAYDKTTELGVSPGSNLIQRILSLS